MFDLSINNFRSFKNQDFKFSRINILIGENSGGKSSLLKFLLSLKQTIDAPYEVNLKLKGDYTDLGNYEEVIYRKNKKNKLKFSFRSHEDYILFYKDIIAIYEKIERDVNSEVDLKQISKNLSLPFLDNLKSQTQITFELTSDLDEHSSINTLIENSSIGYVKIKTNKNKETSSFREQQCDLIFKIGDNEGLIENCLSYKEGFFTMLGIELKKQCELKFKDKFPDIYYPITFLLMFQNYLSNEIEKIIFVNPISSVPKRFYFQEDKKSSYKSIDLEKFINILGDPSLKENDYEEKIGLLNKYINNFGIAEEVQVIKDKAFPVTAVNVKTNGFWSNITDVGYGVSLQIPILFQAILSEKYSRKGDIILIEQPEVHLHPNLQAKFIETLLSIGDKNQYFIETHSEHIIRKLQVLVKNKKYKIKPEDVTIHYFVREEDKFLVSSHNILSNGLLENVFPKGFYDTSYSLAKELL